MKCLSKNNAEERKLRVTLLSAEWKASINGDLTTINRELAIQMAKHPNVEVSVFLPQCSEEDKRHAGSCNVTLIEAVKVPGLKPVLWLASVPEGHAMDCVIGHGVDLGPQIPLIKRNPNYSHCKWIQVVHTAPEEIGIYKSISEGQQKQQIEIELCQMADQVVTIGPKLTDAYKHQLRKQDVFNLTPSIFTEFSDMQQKSDERRFCVLVIESGDSEDFDVKGYNIVVKAIAELEDKSYQLKFASKQKGKEDELADKLLQCGIGRNQLSVCSLDEDRETLAKLFSMVDIAILPSKSEGFGLSALEAISAGLPVLVSGNSGIADALKEVPNGSQCIVDSEDPAHWARAIKAVRDRKRNVRLEEAKNLRENYLQKYSWEKSCDFLVKKMYNLTFDPKLNIKVDVEHVKRADHDAHSTASVSAQEPTGYQKASTASGTKSKGQSDTDLEDPQKEVLCLIAKNYLVNTPPRNRDERNEFKEYLKEMRVIITGVFVGSLMITVKCDSLKSLEELWKDYSCGYLDKMVQDCFVTEKILRELNLAELKLKTTMDIEEHNACKLFFLEKDALRGSTSESPQKQEELKKWKQRTKTVETEKMKDTSPLTVIPTTGHGKELMEEGQGRKGEEEGMLPLLGSSTFDPEELLMEIQRIEAGVLHDNWNRTILENNNSSAGVQHCLDNNTQSIPLPVTETSNMKGRVSVETSGWNPLHYAAKGGNEVIIETLLSSGLDINSRGNDGTTPLMMAAATGQEKTANLLLSKGADPHLKNFMGRNLLHAAAEGGNSSIVMRALSCDIDINSKDDDCSATPLIIAVMQNHIEVVKYLLQKGADISLTTEDKKRNALHIASQEGSVAVIEMKGRVSVETSGWNPLHYAAKGGNEVIIETLLSSGLDINSRGNDGTTPLMMAAATGQEKTLNLLLSKGADPHLKNFMGRNLLHAAAEGGNSSIVMRALSCDIDINSKDDDCSATPLIIAVMQNHIEVVKYLLQKGADISLTTEDKKGNALHIASQEGSVAVIEMLLSYDLRPDSRDGEGNTPLACAAACGQIEAVNCLLKHGADPLLKGQDGRNLLHFAAQSGNVIIIETMLSKGLDINARDETQGVTPLMVCTKFGKLEALKYLLEKGADKSLKTTPGKLPLLSIASAAGSIAAVEMLLSHGCNIDARDSEGDTPLRHAARLGNTEVVEYLLAQGANPLVQNNLELGLLHLAALSDNALTIEAVLSNNFDINARCTAAGLTPLLTCLVQGKLKAANYLLDRGADEYLKGENGLTVLSAAAIGGNVAAIEMLLKRGHNPNSRGGWDKTPLMWAAAMGKKAAVEYLLPLTH